MRKFIAAIIYALIPSSIFFAPKLFILQISYEAYKDFLNTLLTLSGMIFTIMGIWIAYLYPNALQKIKNPTTIETVDFSYGQEDFKRLTYIVGAVLKSAAVMAVIATIFLLKIFLANSRIYVENIYPIKILASYFCILLFVVQIEAVINVVISNILFLRDTHTKKSEMIEDHDF